MIRPAGPTLASAHTSAAQGIARGQSRLLDAAQRQAQGPDVAAAVDTVMATAQIRTNIAVARTADEMTGTLIDTLA